MVRDDIMMTQNKNGSLLITIKRHTTEIFGLAVPTVLSRAGMIVMLIVDAATNACTLLDTGDHSEGKFAGICELDGKVYCCPSNASYVLVIDPGSAAPGSATLSRIQLGMRREDKWSGIVAFEGMLYCAPCGQSSVLQIDPKNKTHNLLETGESATTIDRWDGICECNGRLMLRWCLQSASHTDCHRGGALGRCGSRWVWGCVDPSHRRVDASGRTGC